MRAALCFRSSLDSPFVSSGSTGAASSWPPPCSGTVPVCVSGHRLRAFGSPCPQGPVSGGGSSLVSSVSTATLMVPKKLTFSLWAGEMGARSASSTAGSEQPSAAQHHRLVVGRGWPGTADLRRQIRTEPRGVRPARIPERAGGHVLGHRVQRGHRGVVHGGVRPCGGEDLVCSAAQEQAPAPAVASLMNRSTTSSTQGSTQPP